MEASEINYDSTLPYSAKSDKVARGFPLRESLERRGKPVVKKSGASVVLNQTSATLRFGLTHATFSVLSRELDQTSENSCSVFVANVW